MTASLDKMSFDAFGRGRVSNTGQRLDVEFIYDKQPDFFDEITNGASADVSHNANTRDLTLSVGTTTNGEYATMRSHPCPYTPGNSQLIDLTGVMDLAGIGGGTAEVFLRSNISGTPTDLETVAQASWENLTEASDVDWADSHILMMDFQSLKVGSIRFWLVQNGAPVLLTQINNDNTRDSGYWQLASLPAYWRIYNTASATVMEMGYGDENNAIGLRYTLASADATATMKAICCTVKSEGGLDLDNLEGLIRAADMGVTEKNVSTTLIPLISIKLRETFNSLPNLGLVAPKGFSFQTSDKVRVVVLEDASLTNDSFADVDTDNSIVQVDTAATAVSGGKVLYSDYIPAESTGPSAARSTNAAGGLIGKTVLWDRQDDNLNGILTIAAVATTATATDCLAGLRWEEIR